MYSYCVSVGCFINGQQMMVKMELNRSAWQHLSEKWDFNLDFRLGCYPLRESLGDYLPSRQMAASVVSAYAL